MNDRHFPSRLFYGILAIDWRLLTFCIGFIGVFSFLGFWQLDRAEQKVEVLATLENKRNQRPVEHIEDLKGSIESIDGVPVLLHGEYIPGRFILLDNVVLGGKVGFDLLVWFREIDTNRYFLVNRGFVAMARTRAEVPTIPPIVAGVHSLTGHIYAREFDEHSLLGPVSIGVPEGTPDLMAGNITAKITQQAAPVFLAASEAAIEKDNSIVYPYLIRLTVDDPNGLPRNWIVANISPEKHTGYAIQWFLMAFAIVVLFVRLALKQQLSIDENRSHT